MRITTDHAWWQKPQTGSTDWMQDGVCSQVDPEIFYPTKEQTDIGKAIGVCKGCPVINECLDWALANRVEHGVWGGLSWHQRLRLLRTARREGAA